MNYLWYDFVVLKSANVYYLLQAFRRFDTTDLEYSTTIYVKVKFTINIHSLKVIKTQ